MNDHARALLFVAALFGGGGYTGGRMTVPVPEVELRFVHVPMPAIGLPPVVEAAPTEPPPAPAVTPEPAPVVTAPPAQLEETPLPQPRPKIEAKPKPKPQPKPEPVRKPRKALPSCAFVEREYQRMTLAERWARYSKATPEEIAHGKRCLGF